MADSYQAYGLTISSEIPLPELRPADPEAEPAVEIRLSPTPLTIDQPAVRGALYQASSDRFLLNLNGIGRYLVCNGRQIDVTPAEGHDPAELRLFLYTSPFAALLHQRGDPVMHAAGIVKDGRGVLIAGASGSGKSSLVAAFVRRGYRFLGDELAAIHERAAGEFWVAPGFSSIQLWAQAIDELALSVDGLRPVRAGLQKFVVPLESSFSAEPPALSGILILSRGGNIYSQISELKGLEKFKAVLHATYLPRLVTKTSARAQFDRVNRIAAAVRISSLSFPDSGFSIQAAADLVEEELLRWEK